MPEDIVEGAAMEDVAQEDSGTQEVFERVGSKLPQADERSGLSPDDVFADDQDTDAMDLTAEPGEGDYEIGSDGDVAEAEAETVAGDSATSESVLDIVFPDGETWQAPMEELRQLKQDREVYNQVQQIFDSSPGGEEALRRIGELWGVPMGSPSSTQTPLPPEINEVEETTRILAEHFQLDPSEVADAIADQTIDPQSVLSAKTAAEARSAKNAVTRWQIEQRNTQSQQQMAEKYQRSVAQCQQAVEGAMNSLGASKLFQGKQQPLANELKSVVNDLVMYAHLGANKTPVDAAKHAVSRLLKLVNNERAIQAITARNKQSGVSPRIKAQSRSRSLNDGHPAMSQESKDAIVAKFGGGDQYVL